MTNQHALMLVIGIQLGVFTFDAITRKRLNRKNLRLIVHNARLVEACDYALLETERIGLKLPTQVSDALRKAMEEP